MRAYEKIPAPCVVKPAALFVPGYTLSAIIDEFYAEGVVPDFIPADLGEDSVDEIDGEGWFQVDPAGNIRTDPMEAREAALMAGVKDPDPAPASAPLPPAPDSAPDPTSAPTE